MKHWRVWLTCLPAQEGGNRLDWIHRACVFNQVRILVVTLSAGLLGIALVLKMSPVMARPIRRLLTLVATLTVIGTPVYTLGSHGLVPRRLVALWAYGHSLVELFIALITVHYTGGLESPGNMLVLTYLAGVALVFPPRMVTLLAALASGGYLALGWGYAYGWWQAYYSDGSLQPIPPLRRAALSTLSDLLFFGVVSGLILYLRHLLERAYWQLHRERNALVQLRSLIHGGLQRRDLLHLAHYLVTHLGDLVGAQEVYLALWDRRRQRLGRIISSVPEERETTPKPWQMAIMQRVRNQTDPVLLSGVPETSKAVLATPLRGAEGEFLGAILLVGETDNRFGPAEMTYARDASEVIALVFLRTVAEERLREEVRLLEGLSQWSADLIPTREERDLVRKIGEGAQRLFGASECIVFLHEGEGQTVRVAYVQGTRYDLAQFIAAHYGELAKPFTSPEASLFLWEDLRKASHIPTELRQRGCGTGAIEACALVALRSPQGIEGFLALHWQHPYTFTSVERFVLRLVGVYAGAALHNARLMRYLHQEALTDPLTGLPNRRAFEETLEREVHRARRYGHTFALLMVDLNGFKRINDTYGHVQGDVVLRQTAQALRSALRESDFLARYGGDEFVVLLPETDAQQAYRVAQKLAQHIEQLTFEGLPPEERCGLSAGVAVYPQDATDPRQLLTLADQRMYANKQQQRRAPSA